jgi:glutamine amidotransferase-like uncharacterized protein
MLSTWGSRRGGVCVYAGSGAVLAGDVERGLEALGVSYREVDEALLLQEGLRGKCSILIVPGGYTARMLSALGAEGLEEIRGFVRGGGLYIGICAGAYIAAPQVEVPGRPGGLAIIDVRNVRVRAVGVVEIRIVDSRHPLVEGCPETMRIWYQNGPHMTPGEGVEVIAIYQDGSAAVVSSRYGGGRVILFSPHPEGSSEGGVDAEEIDSLRLLENALKMGRTE